MAMTGRKVVILEPSSTRNRGDSRREQPILVGVGWDQDAVGGGDDRPRERREFPLLILPGTAVMTARWGYLLSPG